MTKVPMARTINKSSTSTHPQSNPKRISRNKMLHQASKWSMPSRSLSIRAARHSFRVGSPTLSSRSRRRRSATNSIKSSNRASTRARKLSTVRPQAAPGPSSSASSAFKASFHTNSPGTLAAQVSTSRKPRCKELSLTEPPCPHQ